MEKIEASTTKTVLNHLHKAGYKKKLDKGKKAQAIAKLGLTTKKMMLCVCEITTSNWRKRLELINRKGVVFHHDNARPHISLITRQKLRKLGWEVLMHPYSSDIALSAYHLFRSLQNSHNGVKLASKQACENHLKQFFDQKQKFYRDGIMALPQKWQNIIENNGAYLV
ncbi:SETMR methyltransferase, partial [Acromyrmex heyeri]